MTVKDFIYTVDCGREVIIIESERDNEIDTFSFVDKDTFDEEYEELILCYGEKKVIGLSFETVSTFSRRYGHTTVYPVVKIMIE